MRKQYSFRRSATGRLDAWDVDRLIRLSADLPVCTVEVDSLAELDEEYWFADSDERATVRKVAEHAQLIAAVDPAYPVILDVDGRVMDGMHRVARALVDGRRAIPAVQFSVQPEPDYRDCAPDDLPYD